MELLNPESIEYIIVHHTHRDNDFPAYIKLRHVYLRGWEDIGYHYVIGQGSIFTRDGKVYAGRSERFVGAHAFGFNRNSIGICLVGNFDWHKPTERQLLSLVSLLKEKMREYDVPVENILGHRELPGVNKTCPGRNVDMDSIRAALS